MFANENLPIIYLGAFFLLIGLVFLWRGKREERAYYHSLMSRRDVRELLTGWPERVGVGALTLGGKISLGVGVILLIIGVIFLLRH